MKKLVNCKYIEMSSDEIAVRKSEKIPDPEPTPEERMAELETTTEDMILLMAELIGGN